MFIDVYVEELYKSEHISTATKRLGGILDEKYKKADLNKVTETKCQYLTITQRYYC